MLVLSCLSGCSAQPDLGSVPAVSGWPSDAFGFSGWLLAFFGAAAFLYWWRRAGIAEASLASYAVGIKDGAAISHPHQVRWCTCGCLLGEQLPNAQPFALRTRAVAFQAGIGAWPHYPGGAPAQLPIQPPFAQSLFAYIVGMMLAFAFYVVFYGGMALWQAVAYCASSSRSKRRKRRPLRVRAARATAAGGCCSSNSNSSRSSSCGTERLGNQKGLLPRRHVPSREVALDRLPDALFRPPPGLSLADNDGGADRSVVGLGGRANASSTAPSACSLLEVGDEQQQLRLQQEEQQVELQEEQHLQDDLRGFVLGFVTSAASDDELGVDINSIVAAMAVIDETVSVDDVRLVVAKLVDDAFFYTTIDDSHFLAI